jgi:UPF0271 protein
MPFITSANVACGFHGSDPHVMRKTVALALRHNVAIGSHPSLPDLMGFGRRVMDLSPAELKDYLCYQTGALREYCRAASNPHRVATILASQDTQKPMARHHVVRFRGDRLSLCRIPRVHRCAAAGGERAL